MALYTARSGKRASRYGFAQYRQWLEKQGLDTRRSLFWINKGLSGKNKDAALQHLKSYPVIVSREYSNWSYDHRVSILSPRFCFNTQEEKHFICAFSHSRSQDRNAGWDESSWRVTALSIDSGDVFRLRGKGDILGRRFLHNVWRVIAGMGPETYIPFSRCILPSLRHIEGAVQGILRNSIKYNDDYMEVYKRGEIGMVNLSGKRKLAKKTLDALSVAGFALSASIATLEDPPKRGPVL